MLRVAEDNQFALIDAAFMLWMLSELLEQLPEASGLPKSKLVFFFDEADLCSTNGTR